MTAKKTRNILVVALSLAVLLLGGLIYFATDYLRAANQTTIHRQIDAEIFADDLSRLQTMKSFLENNQPTVNKAAQIVSDSKQYQYQDQIISDFDRFARQSGIAVNGYDFGSTNEPRPGAPARAVSGVKSIPVTINLDSPMPYDNFLRFLKLLEQNVSKMQVAGISLSPDEKSSRAVANPSISLIIYVR